MAAGAALSTLIQRASRRQLSWRSEPCGGEPLNSPGHRARNGRLPTLRGQWRFVASPARRVRQAGRRAARRPIARRVCENRIVSVNDTKARHTRKSPETAVWRARETIQAGARRLACAWPAYTTRGMSGKSVNHGGQLTYGGRDLPTWR